MAPIQHCVLLLLFLTACVSAQRATYTYDIPVGKSLDLLPGRGDLQLAAGRYRWNIAITQAPITFTMSDSLGQVLTFTAPGYINDATQQPLMFGPTIKLRAGDSMSIRFANGLVQQQDDTSPPGTWGYKNTMDSNIHTHGLHDNNGAPSQASAGSYNGGDNVFTVVKAKKDASDTPNTLNINSKVPRYHMPGVHWYHPHKHGSTAIQTSTSHGLIIVDDNDWWFPWNRGSCNMVYGLLKTAKEVTLAITLLWFKQDPLGPELFAANPTYQWVSGAGNTTYPKNPLCCDPSRTGYAFNGSAVAGGGQDLVLINGGFVPRITLSVNTWQRWRMLYAGAKGWMVVQLLERDLASDTLSMTDRCEMQLFAKDGVYMIKVPRLVPGLIMAAGNRMELFVKCLAQQPGKEYVLSATNKPDPFNPSDNADFASPSYRITQDIIATIAMAPSARASQLRAATKVMNERVKKHGGMAQSVDANGWNLQEESCTPRRASYAVDLRDEALVAKGFDLAQIDRQIVNIDSEPVINGVGCLVNNQSFQFPDPDPLVMKLGKIVEWSYNEVRWHPMHVHTNPFQVVWYNMSSLLPGTLLTNFYKAGDYYDNILVPQIGGSTPFNTGPDNVHLRFQPGNFTGYAVAHCHYLMHEDVGCMKVVKWQCSAPGMEGPDQPASGTCPGFKWPVPGDI